MDYQEFYQKKDSFASESELVEATYHFFNEDSRLSGSKSAQVEFLTTVRYIQRYLSPGDRILDVGAGTGAYSLYFARRGYSVSALELTQRNIEIFRSKLTPQDPIDLQQGNAVDLSRYPDDAFDVVLVFGPLYHLHSMDDRKRAASGKPCGSASPRGSCFSHLSPMTWCFSPSSCMIPCISPPGNTTVKVLRRSLSPLCSIPSHNAGNCSMPAA